MLSHSMFLVEWREQLNANKTRPSTPKLNLPWYLYNRYSHLHVRTLNQCTHYLFIFFQSKFANTWLKSDWFLKGLLSKPWLSITDYNGTLCPCIDLSQKSSHFNNGLVKDHYWIVPLFRLFLYCNCAKD